MSVTTTFNGHRIDYRDHRYECLDCGTRLLSMMQFQGRECRGVPAAGPDVQGEATRCPVLLCPGDARYSPPGRGHTCTGDEWRAATAPAPVVSAEDTEGLAGVLADHRLGYRKGGAYCTAADCEWSQPMSELRYPDAAHRAHVVILLAALVDSARATERERIARKWQLGGWADVVNPIGTNPQQRLQIAQAVTDWIRALPAQDGRR